MHHYNNVKLTSRCFGTPKRPLVIEHCSCQAKKEKEHGAYSKHGKVSTLCSQEHNASEQSGYKVDTNGRCSYAWTSVVGHTTGNVYLYQSCMMASQ